MAKTMWQSPIDDYVVCGTIHYVYKCNGCGVNVAGYILNRVKGKVLCQKCKKLQMERYKNKKIYDYTNWLLEKGYLKDIAKQLDLVEMFVGDE